MFTENFNVLFMLQVFSKSMADGIHFYREQIGSRFLKHSEATENFTRTLNAMFDATNARLPKEGIRPGCVGYKVEMLLLHSNEFNYYNSGFNILFLFKNISDFLAKLQQTDTFATDVTMASLRVTLQSILDLVDYLCEKIAYEYVLTAKFNQDCLEVSLL